MPTRLMKPERGNAHTTMEDASWQSRTFCLIFSSQFAYTQNTSRYAPSLRTGVASSVNGAQMRTLATGDPGAAVMWQPNALLKNRLAAPILPQLAVGEELHG